ncbi:MAG: helix-turn-helix domain-containing protein, partial [Gammaproteobacteria bacterium]|nr:helix-turn-helix domain-containing protein [Gammaproteobacteria bacterium]
MKIVLSDLQKKQLETQHAQTRDGRIRDRIKAVLLASEDWTSRMISQALRIHESTVRTHLAEYSVSEKLKPENGGSSSHLSVAQTAQLIDCQRQSNFDPLSDKVKLTHPWRLFVN